MLIGIGAHKAVQRNLCASCSRCAGVSRTAGIYVRRRSVRGGCGLELTTGSNVAVTCKDLPFVSLPRLQSGELHRVISRSSGMVRRLPVPGSSHTVLYVIGGVLVGCPVNGGRIATDIADGWPLCDLNVFLRCLIR